MRIKRPKTVETPWKLILPNSLEYLAAFPKRFVSFHEPTTTLLDTLIFDKRHAELRVTEPRYDELFTLLEGGGVRLFRFIDEFGSLSRICLFPIKQAWPLLMAEYLQSLPSDAARPVLFSLSTGQYLEPGLLCKDIRHQAGVVTLFVDAPLVKSELEPATMIPIAEEELKLIVPQPPTRSHRTLAEDRRRVVSTCQGPDEEVLVRLAVPITRGDLKTLQGTEWLNDEIINGYMDLINRRDLISHGQRRTIYAFSCFFYTQLSTRQRYSYQRVRNWTTEIDVFELERLIFPIHVRKNHWCLAVINLKTQRFEYYDSLGSSNDHQCLSRLRRWLQDESQDKRQLQFSLTDHQPKEKSQRNNYDCGVFTARAAECVARDVPFDFTQEDISALRILMSIQLLDSTL